MLEHINDSYLTGRITGSIDNYCYHVKTGTKPIAVIGLQTRYVDIVKEEIKNKYELNVHIEEVEGYDGWKTLYVYKHDYLIHIIKSMPHIPQTPYDHWVIGKACGYSDDAIGEFINERFT